MSDSANNDVDPIDSIPVLDDAAALETAGGDPELVDLLRETCVQEVPKLIASAREAIERQDWKTVRRNAHSMRSGLGAIGALAASAKSGEMEASPDDDADAFSSLIRNVEAEFQKVVTRLQG